MSWELYTMMKKFNYMLEIGILRNSSQNNLGVLRGDLLRFGYSKDVQTIWLIEPLHI